MRHLLLLSLLLTSCRGEVTPAASAPRRIELVERFDIDPENTLSVLRDTKTGREYLHVDGSSSGCIIQLYAP